MKMNLKGAGCWKILNFFTLIDCKSARLGHHRFMGTSAPIWDVCGFPRTRIWVFALSKDMDLKVHPPCVCTGSQRPGSGSGCRSSDEGGTAEDWRGWGAERGTDCWERRPPQPGRMQFENVYRAQILRNQAERLVVRTLHDRVILGC